MGVGSHQGCHRVANTSLNLEPWALHVIVIVIVFIAVVVVVAIVIGIALVTVILFF